MRNPWPSSIPLLRSWRSWSMPRAGSSNSPLAEPVPVSYSGGVFEHVGAMFREKFTARLHALRRRLPGRRAGIAARRSAPPYTPRSATAGPCRVRPLSGCARKARLREVSSNHEAWTPRLPAAVLLLRRLRPAAQRQAHSRWRISRRWTKSTSTYTSTHLTRRSSIRRQPTISGLLTINVDYPDFPPLADQSRIAQALVASSSRHAGLCGLVLHARLG